MAATCHQGYLYWDTNSGKLSTELSPEYQAEAAHFYWTIRFVQDTTVRLKNVGTGTFLAVSGGSLVLESTGSSEGLWTYTEDTTHSNNQVTLKNSASNKYLCTAEEPEIADACANSVVEWTISFVSSTVSLSLFTSATRTTTSVTITSVTEGRDKPFKTLRLFNARQTLSIGLPCRTQT